jgi:hypothetical protein
VGGGEDLAEVVDGDERVDLRGRHRGVAEELLHDTDVRPAVEEVGGERVPQRVRRHRRRHAGSLGRLDQDRPRALPGQPPAPGVEEQRRSSPPGTDQLRSRAGEVGGHRVAGIATHGDDPLLAALAVQQHGAVDLVEVVDVETDRLGDAGAGAVQQLQQRAVTQREHRAGRARGLEDRLDVRERQRLGEPLGRRGRLDRRCRVGLRQAVGHREAVEPPHGDDGARGRRRAEGRVGRAPLPQADQERRYRRLGDGVQVVDALTAQELVVAGQVTPVGAERVGRQSALDRQVVEIGADRAVQPRPGAHPRTVSRGTVSMPTAWPTGALVSRPAWVLRPSARLGSSRSACAQPLSASATA